METFSALLALVMEIFRQQAIYQCEGMLQNANTDSSSLKYIQHVKGLEYRQMNNMNALRIIIEQTPNIAKRNCVHILQWRQNECDGLSNHWRLDCLLNRFSVVDQRKRQNSASLAFVRGIQRRPQRGRISMCHPSAEKWYKHIFMFAKTFCR